MATKKDLVEAYSFSRRRLVTAFVSGAPGGREVEPTRPGRAVIGGIALAVLLLAGAAVFNFLGSPVVLDETQEQLISEEESGADYVLIGAEGQDDLQLRPVINITSAMLLLGETAAEPLVVPRERLSELDSGEQIGILQAPATPPPADNLIATGWTACTGVVDGDSVGLKVNVSRDPEVEPTPDVGFVVRSVGDGSRGDGIDDGSLYLIAESARDSGDGRPRAYAYEVPRNADAVLGVAASSSAARATPVPADWLTAFPQGGSLSLASFGLRARQLGDPFDGRTDDGPLRRADVGDLLEFNGLTYLLNAQGRALLLDEFARAVYLAVAGEREPLTGAAPPEVEDSSRVDGARWPTTPTTEEPDGELCALLQTAPDTAPSVVLARAEPGGGASAEDVEAGRRLATVDAGAGALVRSGSWFTEEAPTRVLLDDRAFAYGVAGAVEAERLRYADVPAVVVPDSWIELFVPGVLLSIDTARCPPTSQLRAAPCG